MNTVGDKGRAGKHPQLLQMRYRTQAVISGILLDFPPGFRHVGMHRQVQIMGGLNKFHEKFRRTSVWGMRRNHRCDSSVRFPMPVPRKSNRFRQLMILHILRTEANNPAHQHSTDTR
ncbi:hypothetical protein D3C81_1587020 [compost metagenome]